jgi:hypothetical protein
VDWSDKLDVSKPININPMGELDFNSMYLTYKEDKDYYNTLYKDEYKEIYSEHREYTDNQFINNENKIELIFSPTPVARIFSNGLIAPRFYTMDNGVPKPMELNIRRLHIKAGVQGSHALYTDPSITPQQYVPTTYLFAGMTDGPNSPTVDIGFGLPHKIYYHYGGQTYTTNNRFNARYSRMLAEITSKNSKIVTWFFNLNEEDIRTFSFRDLVFVQGNYYVVNKIIDFNPQERQTTKVEMLKINAEVDFTPTSEDVNGPSGRIAGQNPSVNSLGNYGNSIGTNNINMSGDSLIIGNNNYIGETAQTGAV